MTAASTAGSSEGLHTGRHTARDKAGLLGRFDCRSWAAAGLHGCACTALPAVRNYFGALYLSAFIVTLKVTNGKKDRGHRSSQDFKQQQAEGLLFAVRRPTCVPTPCTARCLEAGASLQASGQSPRHMSHEDCCCPGCGASERTGPSPRCLQETTPQVGCSVRSIRVH